MALRIRAGLQIVPGANQLAALPSELSEMEILRIGAVLQFLGRFFVLGERLDGLIVGALGKLPVLDRVFAGFDGLFARFLRQFPCCPYLPANDPG